MQDLATEFRASRRNAYRDCVERAMAGLYDGPCGSAASAGGKGAGSGRHSSLLRSLVSFLGFAAPR
nr:hypothetical protein [uncultured Gellertiella sp.]